MTSYSLFGVFNYPTATTERPLCQHAILVSSGGSLGLRDLGMLCKAAPWTQVRHGTGQHRSAVISMSMEAVPHRIAAQQVHSHPWEPHPPANMLYCHAEVDPLASETWECFAILPHGPK